MMRAMIKILRPMFLFFIGVLVSSVAWASAPAVPQQQCNVKSVIETLQGQIQTVQASVPKIVHKQAIVLEKQIAELHAQTQKQITVLQKQIQQVQKEANRAARGLQKQIHEVEMIK